MTIEALPSRERPRPVWQFLLDEARRAARVSPADDTAVDVTDVEEVKVPQAVYDDVESGADKEARLRPALPVDTRAGPVR